MLFEFRRITRIILAIALGLSLATSAQAEKKKKVGTETIEQEITKWNEEPSSFLDIKLDQPLNSSVSAECPKLDLGKENTLIIADGKVVKTMPEGSHCYLVVNGEIEIHPIRVPPLIRAYVVTDNGLLTGNFIKMDVRYRTFNFEEVKNIFTSKYGTPYKQTISKFKTNGGAEFDNHILDWQGKNVTIHIESLKDRKLIENKIIETGLVTVSTKSYRDKLKDTTDRSVQESASKL